ncbi:DMT family transporter [Bosea sp. TWI1241]|uniref:DMT family transporter n=1 Tax=Bosea sp. TWI1241 TaxID=3148904 RepID=UPI003208A5F1
MESSSPRAAADDRQRWRLAFAGLAVAILIFGANFPISRHAVLNGLTSHDVLALRFATAGAILLPTFLMAGGVRSWGGLGFRRALTLAVMGGFPMSFLVMTGLTYAPAAHGAVIGPGTVTLIGIVGGVVLFGAKLTRNLVLGVVAVLIGLACLGIAGTSQARPEILFGDLCFLGVGLIWGGYPLAIQLWRVDPLKGTAVVSVLSMLYLPFYFLFWFRGFDVAPWWVLLVHAVNQGVLNVVVGLWLWSWSAPILGPSVAGRFPPMIPVVGTVLAIPLLGEIPGWLQIVGIVFIVSGLFFASLRRPGVQPRQARDS